MSRHYTAVIFTVYQLSTLLLLLRCVAVNGFSLARWSTATMHVQRHKSGTTNASRKGIEVEALPNGHGRCVELRKYQKGSPLGLTYSENASTGAFDGCPLLPLYFHHGGDPLPSVKWLSFLFRTLLLRLPCPSSMQLPLCHKSILRV